MTKFSLVTFKITNGGYEHYEYSYYESKNISGISHKQIVQEVYDGEDIEVDKNDMHKFWLCDLRTVEVYGIEPMTDVELGVFKKFGVL